MANYPFTVDDFFWNADFPNQDREKAVLFLNKFWLHYESKGQNVYPNGGAWAYMTMYITGRSNELGILFVDPITGEVAGGGSGGSGGGSGGGSNFPKPGVIYNDIMDILNPQKPEGGAGQVPGQNDGILNTKVAGMSVSTILIIALITKALKLW